MDRNFTPQERRRLITMLADDGLSAAQIALRLKISRQRIHKIAAAMGLQIGKRGGTARIGAFVPRPLIDNVRAIAKAAGVSNSVMVARTIKAVFADPATARRVLGKDAMPVRGYRAEG